MNIRPMLKYGAIAFLLGFAGFILAIGVLTLVFAPKAGAYAPVNSSDAAAWIQAIGSIGAIIGAFMLGSRQAKDARTLAETMANAQKFEREKAYFQVIGLLFHATSNALTELNKRDIQIFHTLWSVVIENRCQGLLKAFDDLPLHELGSTKRVLHAAEMRAVVVDILNVARYAVSDDETKANLPESFFHDLAVRERALVQTFDALKAAYPPEIRAIHE